MDQCNSLTKTKERNLRSWQEVKFVHYISASEILKIEKTEMPMGTLTYSMRASLECLKNVA